MKPDPTNEQRRRRDPARYWRQVGIDEMGEGSSENDRRIVARSFPHEANATETRQTVAVR